MCVCVSDNILKHMLQTKYTGCNLKTTELLDRAVIGVCSVIRSNTVYVHFHEFCKT